MRKALRDGKGTTESGRRELAREERVGKLRRVEAIGRLGVVARVVAGGELARRVFDGVGGGGDIAEIAMPGVAELHPASAPFDQGHPKRMFEHRNLAADGGLADAQDFRRGGEAAGAGGHGEGMERVERRHSGRHDIT